MQVSFTWKVVPPLICIPRKDGRDNVVYKVNWTVTAYSDHTPPLVTMHSDSTEFETIGATFTPLEDLTEEQVMGWVKEELSASIVHSMEVALKERLYIESLPKTVDMPLPWEK